VVALREALAGTKLTAADPWTYTGKARGWGVRAQGLIDDLLRGGETPALRGAFDTLRSEIESDPDYREACRRA
jgi:hypothetical protein